VLKMALRPVRVIATNRFVEALDNAVGDLEYGDDELVLGCVRRFDHPPRAHPLWRFPAEGDRDRAGREWAARCDRMERAGTLREPEQGLRVDAVCAREG